MRYRFIFIIFLLSLLIGQQHRLFWDGGDWRRLNKKAYNQPDLEYQLKAAYINGLMDGRLYDYLKLWAIDQALSDSIFQEMSDYLSTGELVKAVDHFYEDSYNLTIPVPSAVIIATMYAEQVPLNYIDDYVKQCRFWINNLYYQMENDNAAEILERKIRKYETRKQKNRN